MSSTRPMLIDLPQPPSTPGTPSEMPGTPTSTTTSLSALSTTAIKDGHRGAPLPPHGRGGHHSNPSTNSLEAERADRISRLTGLSSISRPNNNQSGSAQTTPTSSGFLPGVQQQQQPVAAQYLTPAYFDAQGQPVAATKMSTVGTASASTATTFAQDRDEEMGMGGDARDNDNEDLLSMDTNYDGEGGGSVSQASLGGYRDRDRDMDPMEEDRSVEGDRFDQDQLDRMSDDGSASLVGFGEGAGSTVSGPIYHRRQPVSGGFGGSSAGAMDRHLWGLDRRDSGGLSVGASASGGDGGLGAGGRRETVVGRPLQTGLPGMGTGSVGGGGGADTPVTGAEREHRAALNLDGVAVDHHPVSSVGAGSESLDGNGFVDTSARGPVPVTSALRETQQPGVQQQQVPPSAQYPGGTSREAAERIVRERLGGGEEGLEKGDAVMKSPPGEQPGLGKFYFEERK